MQEHEAIARLRRSDISGLDALITIHQVKAARTAYLIVRDAAAAEDIVADAFLHAYERIGQFDAQRPFGPWFLRIVVNLAKRAASKRERFIPLENPAGDEDLTLEHVLIDLAPGLEELAEQAEVQSVVWEALGRLSPTQRAAIIQRYYLDLSEKEIAANAGSPTGTVKWRLHTAREHLRDWLRPLWPADSE